MEYRHAEGAGLLKASERPLDHVIAVIDDHVVARLPVAADALAEWGRVVVRQAAFLLPAGIDPVVGLWLATGDPAARLAAVAAAAAAERAATPGSVACGVCRAVYRAGTPAWPDHARQAAHEAGWAIAHTAAGAAAAAGMSRWDATTAALAAVEATQASALATILWREYATTLSVRERAELSRELRYARETVAAAAVFAA